MHRGCQRSETWGLPAHKAGWLENKPLAARAWGLPHLPHKLRDFSLGGLPEQPVRDFSDGFHCFLGYKF